MTCLLTANIGDFDQIREGPKQTLKHRYKCYGEAPLPLSDLSNRMKAKYVKLQHYKFLPDYDTFIWIDGRIEIISPNFLKDITSHLEDHDIVITKHQERQTTGEEYRFILGLMAADNQYLLSRYSPQSIIKESELISPFLPLYACGVFAWKVTEKMKRFFNAWWEKCLQYSSFDQCWFSYLANYFKLKVFPYSYDLIKLNKHR